MSRRRATDEPMNYGLIDENTPLGRVFEFPPGAMWGDVALPATLKLTSRIDAHRIGLVAPDGADFPSPGGLLGVEEWNVGIAPHCTGYTDGPTTKARRKANRQKTKILIETVHIGEKGEIYKPVDPLEEIETVTQALRLIKQQGDPAVTYRIVRLCKRVTVNKRSVERTTLDVV